MRTHERHERGIARELVATKTAGAMIVDNFPRTAPLGVTQSHTEEASIQHSSCNRDPLAAGRPIFIAVLRRTNLVPHHPVSVGIPQSVAFRAFALH
jgi:hypothetical protein